jgi:uncharacterized protein (DUF1499 family)
MQPHPSALLWLALLALPVALAAAPTELDPTRVERTGRPNDRLVCPPGACLAPADAAAPTLELPPGELLERWRRVIRAQPRVTVLVDDAEGLRLVVQQESRLWGFQDTVAVRVLPQGPGRSSFAAYSRSETGYWDLGVNARRLEQWIQAVLAGPGPG